MTQKFTFIRKDRANSQESLDGIEFCYRQTLSDYGLARDDTRVTGIEHITVTLKEDGGYPGFTIPRDDVEPVEESDGA